MQATNYKLDEGDGLPCWAAAQLHANPAMPAQHSPAARYIDVFATLILSALDIYGTTLSQLLD
jgi:hypothetical protein